MSQNSIFLLLTILVVPAYCMMWMPQKPPMECPVKECPVKECPVKPCPGESNGNCTKFGDGWKNFTRPPGVEWCMKIFYGNSISQPTAEQRCQAQGATLSGLQNQMESQYVVSTVTRHIYPQTGSVWVGMARRPFCLEGLTRDCTWATSFQWTDKSATGTDGFGWAANRNSDGNVTIQPDNEGRTQHCGVLTVSYQGSVEGFQTGLLDDVACDVDFIKMDKKERDIKAYICGKKP
ncbi:hypothetical protein B9Z55_007259 [Caenorhabditis nigoni]|uniref:C-type lectin domain-containing protein n=1 Tax=Caenorhabditis nigoni TaxID=1611254 RepID=A0A2G5V8P8_9PELO|nr:hypothetical protein B9Z55_007259 [Caenorhabditis nigoni]